MSILEVTRQHHAALHQLEQEITNILSQQTRQHKTKVIDNHRVNRCLEEISSISSDLVKLYNHPERKRALEEITVEGDDFTEFYNRLKKIKEEHKRFPISYLKMHTDVDVLNKTRNEIAEEVENLFSGEEMFGKYLDLTISHTKFLNLKGVKKIIYQNYVGECDNFSLVPKETRQSVEYLDYLEELKIYLEGFFQRSQPLYNFISMKQRLLKEFNEKYASGSLSDEQRPLQQSAKELWCEACQKQFTNPATFEAHKTGKKHLKAVQDKKSNSSKNHTNSEENPRHRSIAMNEYLIKGYLMHLSNIREDTKAFVDTKQLLTEKERLALIEEEEAPEEEEKQVTQEDDEKIYNPLKLPLGWDGKPIPYWLYKLHGLGIEYTCEICGNFVYMGRKIFDKHFTEWRHNYGMRCLGIPNTSHFHDITLIKDAYQLWEKLKNSVEGNEFKSEVMEECEDSQGNILNKKTYDDLRRQGLI